MPPAVSRNRYGSEAMICDTARQMGAERSATERFHSLPHTGECHPDELGGIAAPRCPPRTKSGWSEPPFQHTLWPVERGYSPVGSSRPDDWLRWGVGQKTKRPPKGPSGLRKGSRLDAWQKPAMRHDHFMGERITRPWVIKSAKNSSNPPLSS